MATALATIVGQKYASSSEEYQSNRRSCGYTTSPDYYPYLMKFTTPNINGNITKITFSISAAIADSITIKSQAKNWAIATSDENRTLYDNTRTSVTGDEYQIHSGGVTFSSLTTSYKNYSFSWELAEGESLLPNTDYFLYMWASTQSYCYIQAITSGNHSITIEYEESTSGNLVYVGNLVGVPYIGVNGEWKSGVAYIGVNGEWKAANG